MGSGDLLEQADPHTQLLPALPVQRLLDRLPRLLLASGQLPQPAQGLRIGTLGRDQPLGPVRVVQQRGGHDLGAERALVVVPQAHAAPSAVRR